LEIEERKLWKFIKDPETDLSYKSLDNWIKKAAPASFSDSYAAMRAIKDLRDMPFRDLVDIPRCNIETLRLLPAKDRIAEIEMKDGKRISITEAARTMRKKEFLTEIQKRFHIKPKPLMPIGGRLLGAAINFPGLQHAPVNEQGVVLLFGMVAKELGFVVEMVRTNFPDCEAKRCVGRDRNGKERLERLKIEFEFQSHNFVEHHHDVNGCDLIVCWENNWPDCPLEVLELGAIIDDLGTGGAPLIKP
jgi:hypothetical protein